MVTLFAVCNFFFAGRTIGIGSQKLATACFAGLFLKQSISNNFFFFCLKCKIADWAAEASLKEKPFMFVAMKFFYTLRESEEMRCSALETCFFCAL